MSLKLLVLVIFALTYGSVVAFPRKKTAWMLLGACGMLAVNVLASPHSSYGLTNILQKCLLFDATHRRLTPEYPWTRVHLGCPESLPE